MSTCNGINCTSDGTTLHSSECIAEHILATVGISLTSLQTDALRYRGLRLLICEPVEATRTQMLDACDKMMMAQPDFDEPAPTSQRVDELFDQIILIAAGARNGGS